MPYIKKSTGRVLSLLEERAYNKSRELREITCKAMSIQDIQQSGKPYYVFIGELNACDQCKDLHGIAFPTSRAVAGTNFPPLHPNCKCMVKPYVFSGGQITIPWNDNDNPGNIAPDDWLFYGPDGNSLSENPERIYTNDYWGKPIAPEDYESLHVVDWIARILFHETGELDTQAAILWCIMNRFLSDDNYTYGQPNTLINILAASGAYEVFDPANNDESHQDPYSPLEWIARHPTFSANGNSTKAAWENAIQLAKLFVSIYGNPYMTAAEKRAVFEQWVPNPFPEFVDGVEVDPYEVTFHVGLGFGTAVFFIPVGDSWFGYTYQ